MKTPFDIAAAQLSALTDWQLKELRVMIETLIEVREEYQESQKPTKERKERVYTNNTNVPGKRGHIEAKYIPRKGKRYGPYDYLRYWWGGSLRSRYIGKSRASSDTSGGPDPV